MKQISRKLKYATINKSLQMMGEIREDREVCKKIGFSSRKVARKVLKRLKSMPGRHKNHEPETYVYRCRICINTYHITSAEKRI